MKARARTVRPKLIGVDHLQIIAGASPAEHYKGMTEKVGASSGALKRMAKELNAVVIALAQLARPEKGKEDQRPKLEDLRWAGEIEQDADIVIGLYRPHYYLERTPEAERDARWEEAWQSTQNITEAHVLKRRGGPGANKMARAYYDPAIGIFSDPPPAGPGQGEPPPQGEFDAFR